MDTLPVSRDLEHSPIGSMPCDLGASEFDSTQEEEFFTCELDLDTLPVTRGRAGSLNDIHPEDTFDELIRVQSSPDAMIRDRSVSVTVTGTPRSDPPPLHASGGVRPPTIQFSDDDDI